MEKLILRIRQKFNALDKSVKVLICIVFIIILGSLLFGMGKQIGEANYKAFANQVVT